LCYGPGVTWGGQGGAKAPAIFFYLRNVLTTVLEVNKQKIIVVSAGKVGGGFVCIFMTGSNPSSNFFLNWRLCTAVPNTLCRFAPPTPPLPGVIRQVTPVGLVHVYEGIVCFSVVGCSKRRLVAPLGFGTRDETE
jgi:hypothetical protein